MILNRNSFIGSTRSAFTLIELMVVMGLIMVVMTIGIPKLIYNNETPLGGSLSAVMDACAAARTKAILSGQTTKVIIDNEILKLLSLVIDIEKISSLFKVVIFVLVYCIILFFL